MTSRPTQLNNSPTGEMGRRLLKCTHSPNVRFAGRLIAGEAFETRGRDAYSIEMQVWESEGGAWIAFFSSEPLDFDGVRVARSFVSRPGSDDAQRQIDVLAFFDWQDRARTMLRKQLGWKFTVDVE